MCFHYSALDPEWFRILSNRSESSEWIGLGLDWAASIGLELIGADLAVLDKVGSDLFIFIVRQFFIKLSGRLIVHKDHKNDSYSFLMRFIFAHISS